MSEFSKLGLRPSVLSAIEAAGYKEPTPIQSQAIPPALEGRDVLGIAQTGTGKTASFVLPMVNALVQARAKARMPRSIVLAPTRELATQVAESFRTYSENSNLTMALLIGGVSLNDQLVLVDRGVDVLIATPGRLLDLFERGRLLLSNVKIVTVDEADRMLDMGFIPDIERIFQLTPFTRQTLFFSATMAPEIERLTNEFLSNPVRVEVTRRASVGENIAQKAVMFSPNKTSMTFKEKRALVRQVIQEHSKSITNCIIFCNRKVDVDVLLRSMLTHKIDCAAIHGDLSQHLRTEVLNNFRDGAKRFLIASDVAARGLDISNVSHVINFDVPPNPEDYIHRIGRTGRAGRQGTAITLVCPQDLKGLQAIESLAECKIVRENAVISSVTHTSKDQTAGGKRKNRRTSKSHLPNKKLPNTNDIATKTNEKEQIPVVGLGDHVPAFLKADF